MEQKEALALLKLIAKQDTENERLRDELKRANDIADYWYERSEKNERVENHG